MTCPRRFVIRSIQEDFEDNDSEEFGNTNIDHINESLTKPSFQTKIDKTISSDPFPSSRVVLPQDESAKSFKLEIIMNGSKNVDKCDHCPNITSNNYITPVSENWNSIVGMVKRIEGRKHLWTGLVRKERSPTVLATVNNSEASNITIDEGSEINVIDLQFCLRWKIKYNSTSHMATAAGSTSMPVVGQTLNDITIYPLNCDAPVRWNLGPCIVVENLGVNLLVGEPGKLDKNCKNS